MADFAHLHVHSEYSLLDGLSKIPKLVTQAKIMGMKHIALTDHGALYGAIKFYKSCKVECINPIIVCEMYITKRSLKQKETPEDKANYHLTVLAQNFEGYKNLMKLITIANLEGFYYRPRVDKETLARHSKGLMALSGCVSSEISQSFIKTYREIFGKDNFFLEVQRHRFDEFISAHTPGSEIRQDLEKMAREEKQIIAGAKKLSEKLDVKLVATNDVHYVLPTDAQAQDAIVCIQTGKNIADANRLRMIDSPTYFLKSTDEMLDLFEDLPQAVKNSRSCPKSK